MQRQLGFASWLLMKPRVYFSLTAMFFWNINQLYPMQSRLCLGVDVPLMQSLLLHEVNNRI